MQLLKSYLINRYSYPKRRTFLRMQGEAVPEALAIRTLLVGSMVTISCQAWLLLSGLKADYRWLQWHTAFICISGFSQAVFPGRQLDSFPQEAHSVCAVKPKP